MSRCVIIPFSDEFRKLSVQDSHALSKSRDSFSMSLPKLLHFGEEQSATVWTLIDSIKSDFLELINGRVPEAADRIASSIPMTYAFAIGASLHVIIRKSTLP